MAEELAGPFSLIALRTGYVYQNAYLAKLMLEAIGFVVGKT
jgi:hypothetical protein